MNENLPSNVQLDANGNGTVIFATDVIATIAGLAATEVEGVASMSGSSSGSGLVDIFTRKSQNSKSLTRGVRVELGENNSVNIHLTIVVDYGTPIPEVAGNIQENVKKAIETMSGLNVTSVDVHVQGVSFEREMRTAAEIEQKQRLMLKDEASKAASEPEPASAPEPAPAPEPEPQPDSAEEESGDYELDLGDEPEDDEAESSGESGQTAQDGESNENRAD